jgi:hypothetical protein
MFFFYSVEEFYFFPLLRILISFTDFDNLRNKNKETVVHEQLNCV